MDPVIWTARPRVDHVVIFQASAPRIFNAAALIALVAAGDLALGIASVAGEAVSVDSEGTASVVVADLAVIASAVADSVAAALAGLAAALEASGVDADINVLNLVLYFFKK